MRSGSGGKNTERQEEGEKAISIPKSKSTSHAMG